MTIQAFSSRLPRFALAALVAAFVGAPAWAQEPKPEAEQDEASGPSPVELARQIRRNMLKIEEDLSKAGTHDPARGERVKKDLDELIDSMKQRQDQVVKDIDEIVKQIKVSKCNSGGQGESDSNENQKNSRARDRNQAQNQGKPRDPNKSGKPKDGKKPGKKKGNGPEDNSKKEEPQGDNDPGDPKAQPKGEKVPHVNINEIWGNLPQELRQKLVDRNYDDFTPEYKEQIEEYFRKTGTAPKNN